MEANGSPRGSPNNEWHTMGDYPAQAQGDGEPQPGQPEQPAQPVGPGQPLPPQEAQPQQPDIQPADAVAQPAVQPHQQQPDDPDQGEEQVTPDNTEASSTHSEQDSEELHSAASNHSVEGEDQAPESHDPDTTGPDVRNRTPARGPPAPSPAVSVLTPAQRGSWEAISQGQNGATRAKQPPARAHTPDPPTLPLLGKPRPLNMPSHMSHPQWGPSEPGYQGGTYFTDPDYDNQGRPYYNPGQAPSYQSNPNKTKVSWDPDYDPIDEEVSFKRVPVYDRQSDRPQRRGYDPDYDPTKDRKIPGLSKMTQPTSKPLYSDTLKSQPNFTEEDFPPLVPRRLAPEGHPQIKIETLPFKLQAFTGAIDQDPEEFLSKFKLAATVLNWTADKLPAIFHMCLGGAARLWFLGLDKRVQESIYHIYRAFMHKYKTMGLDWAKEAAFTSLRQLPTEAAVTFADRVIEKGSVINKTDRELLQQFVRGLSQACRMHTVATGPETFEQAYKTAMLFESAKSFDSDGTPRAQTMAQSVRPSYQAPQNRAHVRPHNNPPTCAYCKRVGHTIEECRTRRSNNARRDNNQPQRRPQQPTTQYRPHSQGDTWASRGAHNQSTRPRTTTFQPQHNSRQHQGPNNYNRAGRPSNDLYTPSRGQLRCHKCDQPGHFARECPQNRAESRPFVAQESWLDDDPIPNITFRRRQPGQGDKGRHQDLN